MSHQNPTTRLTVPPEHSPERLDRFLSQAAEDVSRARFQAIITDARVTVKGRTIVEASHRVKPGDVVEYEMPEAENYDVEPEDIPLDIYFEDDDLIVINKPSH